jgi:type I site-specific restriction endonuclease
MLTDFAGGKMQYVVNVGCLTEGFDDAGVEVIVMGRPTKSRSLYAQMVGRATRPAEVIAHALNDEPNDAARRAMIAASPKAKCLVVDFVGNSGKHKLCTTADILGGNVSDAAVEMVLKKVRESGKPEDMAKALSGAEAELERRRQAEAAQRARLVAKANYRVSSVNPFDVFDITPRKERGWDHGKQLTEKQRDLLLKNKIDADALPYHEAKQLLDEIFRRIHGGLSSFGQTQVLKRAGFVAPMRREEASKAIDRVAQREGWARRTA